MNTGRFFFLDKDSDPTKGMLLFRYRRLKDPINNQYKVYLTIQRDAIEFFYTSKGHLEHTRLFKLSMFNNTNPQGDIFQQLNFIRDLKNHIALCTNDIKIKISDLPRLGVEYSTYASLECWPDLPHSVDNLSHYYELNLNEKEKGWYMDISFPTLFLDFLFDMRHSDIFRESPYFEKIRRLIQENSLFNAISAKAEYYYQAIILLNDNNNQITQQHYKDASKDWLQALMDDENASMISNSNWFLSNIEEEIEEVQEKDLKNDTIVLSDMLSRSIVDFYLDRMNYIRAVGFSLKRREGQTMLFLSILALIISSLIFLYRPLVGLRAVIIPALFVLLFSRIQPLPHKRTKPLDASITEIFDLFMPRLQITLFLAWLTYSNLSKATPQMKPQYAIIPLVFMLVLIFLYLMRAIKKAAPDIEIRQRVMRSSFIFSFAFISSGTMGAFFLSFALRSSEDLEDIFFFPFQGFDFAPVLWFNATIFVMFFGLFVNLLFREKKLTGF